MQEIYNLLLEIYKVLQNAHAIAVANNQFQQSFDERLSRLEAAVVITPEAAPNAAGTDKEEREQ